MIHSWGGVPREARRVTPDGVTVEGKPPRPHFRQSMPAHALAVPIPVAPFAFA